MPALVALTGQAYTYVVPMHGQLHFSATDLPGSVGSSLLSIASTE